MDNKKATALHYDMDKNNAPKLVAKGEKYLAQKIIDVAKKHNIPIKEDKDMVELLSKLEINQEIPPNMYKAIAEIFSFVYKLSKEDLNEKTNK
jgi:flagellar biosynthesis protein